MRLLSHTYLNIFLFCTFSSIILVANADAQSTSYVNPGVSYECANPDGVSPIFTFNVQPYKFDGTITVTPKFNQGYDTCPALSTHTSTLNLQSAPFDLKSSTWSHGPLTRAGDARVQGKYFYRRVGSLFEYLPDFIDGTYSGYILTDFYAYKGGTLTRFSKYAAFSFTLGSSGGGATPTPTPVNAEPTLIVNGVPSASARNNFTEPFTFYSVASDDRGIKSFKVVGLNRTFYDLQYTSIASAPKSLNRNAAVFPSLIPEGTSSTLHFIVEDFGGKTASQSFSFTRPVTPTPTPTTAPVITFDGVPSTPATEDFTLVVNVSAPAKLKSVNVFVDSDLIYESSFPSPTHGGLSFSKRIQINDYSNGYHLLSIVATAYNNTETKELHSFGIQKSGDGGNGGDSTDPGSGSTGNDNDSGNGNNPDNSNGGNNGDNGGSQNPSQDNPGNQNDTPSITVLQNLINNLSDLLNKLVELLNSFTEQNTKSSSATFSAEQALLPGLINAAVDLIYQISKIVSLQSGIVAKSAAVNEFQSAAQLSEALSDITSQHADELSAIDPKFERMPRLTNRLSRFSSRLVRAKKSRKKRKILGKIQRTVKKIKRLSN